ncbi:hypothetical protein F383_08717 [Gossypium arboreum]|uniref:Uncharacterized protein n=1 Tax=Gossypium arboreum TaxID=29729 RepID=A0A0B0PJB4_GOSAR|nr:hypothetical protein F383_08717 [Gossypium arboreum]
MVTHFINTSTHSASKPSFFIIFSTKLHSILSYALLISSFTAINPFFPPLLFFRVWRISYANRTLSQISLPGTKAL